jgi:hypothetical protein
MSVEMFNKKDQQETGLALAETNTGGFLKVFRVQNGKFVLVMSQGINFVVTSQRIFHFGRLDAH